MGCRVWGCQNQFQDAPRLFKGTALAVESGFLGGATMGFWLMATTSCITLAIRMLASAGRFLTGFSLARA